MAERKRIESGVLAVAMMLFGIVVLLAAGASWAMFPSQTSVAMGIAAAGILLIVAAWIIRPQLAIDIATSRRTFLWINDAMLVLAILGIGVMLSIVATRRHVRWDLTRDQLFSVSDHTTKVLKDLKKEVKVTAFFPNGEPAGILIQDLMREFRSYSDKVQFRQVDPFRDPMTTRAMNVQAAGVVVVQSDEQRKDLMPDELFLQSQARGMQSERPKFQGEQAIVSAILNVTSGRKRKVVFTAGHGEPALSAFSAQGLAGFKQSLGKENFDVAEINTAAEKIATDVSILAIISPKKPFMPEELKMVQEFLKNKGRLLIALDPTSNLKEVDSFLVEQFGVVMGPQIVIDNRRIFNDPTNVIPVFTPHAIVKDQMNSKMAVLMNEAGNLAYEKKDAWMVTTFLSTTGETFAKRFNDIAAGNFEFNGAAGDVRGPHNLGLALEGQGDASGSRAVLFADSDFLTNKLLQVQGNADLIVNTVNWLAGQEQMISIRPKSFDIGTVTLDNEARNRILILTIFVSPLMILLVGGTVWFWRRRV